MQFFKRIFFVHIKHLIQTFILSTTSLFIFMAVPTFSVEAVEHDAFSGAAFCQQPMGYVLLKQKDLAVASVDHASATLKYENLKKIPSIPHPNALLRKKMGGKAWLIYLKDYVKFSVKREKLHKGDLPHKDCSIEEFIENRAKVEAIKTTNTTKRPSMMRSNPRTVVSEKKSSKIDAAKLTRKRTAISSANETKKRQRKNTIPFEDRYADLYEQKANKVH
ncbi:MAG: hypothetical protein Q8S21_04350 [Candidatus Paracaedibacteraceae bacterium]|nr:hypothetical protein [Candidatus Paracaedibacteraceae bacterium]